MHGEASIYECPTCGSSGTCQGGWCRSFFGFMTEQECPHYITKEQAETLRKEREIMAEEAMEIAKIQLENRLKGELT